MGSSELIFCGRAIRVDIVDIAPCILGVVMVCDALIGLLWMSVI